jgi:glycosyltransferase involved in cell wall biosynthesis
MDGRLPVLLVSPDASLGGAENVLLHLASRLDERFEVRVLVMGEGPLVARLEALDVPVHVEPLPGRGSLKRFPAVAHHWGRRLQGDVGVIHGNGAKAALLGALLAPYLKAPLVWMKHDHVYDGARSRMLATRCDHVVCVSSALSRQFSSLGERVSVIHPGADLRDVGSAAETEPVVVSLGRLDPHKGGADVLRAVALLRAEGVPARVRLVGHVAYQHPHHARELQDLAAELGLPPDSVAPGWTDDLDAVYRQARVVALASRPRSSEHPGEGFGLVVAEAMAAARPVVSGSLAGAAELIGDSGTLVDHPGPAQLAAALRPYLQDPDLAARAGAAGRARVAAGMTIGHMVEQLASLYVRLAAGQRRR